MSKPVFVCLPEAFHSARIYDPLKEVLHAYGYNVVQLDLPSMGGNPVIYDFTEDVQAIRSLIAQIANSGAEIIVVLHGYAGLPGGEAMMGLSKRERESAGLTGGVVRIVFVMSYIAPEGFRASARADTSSIPSYTRYNMQTGLLTADPETSMPAFYNDLPAYQATYLLSQLLPQSIGVYWSRTTYASWRYIPSTYVLCSQDRAMPLQYAEIVLHAARTSIPNQIDRIERCDLAGHFVMLSQPHWMANMLRRAAGERV